MDIDQQIAAALDFPKREYVSVERERRWLCRSVPRDRIRASEAIVDLYVTGTRLRLREARPLDGGPTLLRLSRKADIDARTRLVTSIYLPEQEFHVLANLLPGTRIRKLRHRLHSESGAALIVDEFQDGLRSLILAEAAFETDARMAGFPSPDFALREVTDDRQFTGGYLAMNGIPKVLT